MLWDYHTKTMLNFVAEEIMEVTVNNESDIHNSLKEIINRFDSAREKALLNKEHYLSIVNELDVYVATSMRKRSDFSNMARDCKYIFSQDGLKRFCPRYFDPTISAANRHEDKGLIECLMVKCAKALLYFAGHTDSFGKDAEIAMAMSLGKPVIIICPDDEIGTQRMKFFKDVHPLSRLIHFETGVVCGAMVTQNRNDAAQLLERIFDNSMEYNIDHTGDRYFRLRERLTESVVRIMTNDSMLREAFWNNWGVSIKNT